MTNANYVFTKQERIKPLLFYILMKNTAKITFNNPSPHKSSHLILFRMDSKQTNFIRTRTVPTIKHYKNFMYAIFLIYLRFPNKTNNQAALITQICRWYKKALCD